MTNYWLRTNIYDDSADYGQEFELWDRNFASEYSVGDQLIIYITKGKNQYFLVGIYEVIENGKARPQFYLPEDEWVIRPSVSEWKNLIGGSVVANSHFNINNNKSWVGRVASRGLKLTENDFNNLKNLIHNKEGSVFIE